MELWVRGECYVDMLIGLVLLFILVLVKCDFFMGFNCWFFEDFSDSGGCIVLWYFIFIIMCGYFWFVFCFWLSCMWIEVIGYLLVRVDGYFLWISGEWYYLIDVVDYYDYFKCWCLIRYWCEWIWIGI